MASEKRRHCGYRKVGALYLCGDCVSISCDRLPYELTACPICGAGIHFTRSMTLINPLKLFGKHSNCKDKIHPCLICDPTEQPSYIMAVGKKFYTPKSFAEEAKLLGVSKRIAQIPKNLKLGETIVYLSHPDAVQVKVEKDQDKKGNKYLFPQDEFEGRLGIFCAFVPKRVELLVWESQLKGKGSKKLKQSLKKRGITPISIRDGDKDHS